MNIQYQRDTEYTRLLIYTENTNHIRLQKQND